MLKGKNICDNVIFKKSVVKSENLQSGEEKPGGVCLPLAGAEATDQPEVTQGRWKVYEAVTGYW